MFSLGGHLDRTARGAIACGPPDARRAHRRCGSIDIEIGVSLPTKIGRSTRLKTPQSVIAEHAPRFEISAAAATRFGQSGGRSIH
jgi:hypothetical protein